jgi:hypothetical protein
MSNVFELKKDGKLLDRQVKPMPQSISHYSFNEKTGKHHFIERTKRNLLEAMAMHLNMGGYNEFPHPAIATKVNAWMRQSLISDGTTLAERQLQLAELLKNHSVCAFVDHPDPFKVEKIFAVSFQKFYEKKDGLPRHWEAYVEVIKLRHVVSFEQRARNYKVVYRPECNPDFANQEASSIALSAVAKAPVFQLPRR